MKRFIACPLLLTLLTPVLATGVLPPIFVNKPAAALPVPVVSFVYVGGISNSGSTLTASNVTFGATAGFATRRIIVEIMANVGAVNTNPFLSATIGGISATSHVNTGSGTGSLPWCAILSADVPTGNTNQTVTITFTSSVSASGYISVYSVDDALLVSTTPTTGSNTTGSSVTSLGTASTVSETVNGFVVGGARLGGNQTAVTFTGFTTDYNNSGGSIDVVTANEPTIASTGPATPAATWTGAQANNCMVAASWR